MTDTSLSKGCFIYKPKQSSDPFLNFKNEIWNQAFIDVWSDIESKLKDHKDNLSGQLIKDLIHFAKSATSINNKIPTAALLIGVNLPDHSSLFSLLISHLKKNICCRVAILSPVSCSTIKNTIEVMASQFMNNNSAYATDKLVDEDDSEEEENNGQTYKKSFCSMPALLNWYKSRKDDITVDKNFKLIVILPDFEGLSPKVIHDFLLILSCYMSKLPLVVIMGVATTASVIGDMLEHSVTSKLCIEFFQSQRSVHFLNQVLNEIFLREDCPFQLESKMFKFLINTFLFYDFSVCKFTLGIKFCLMEHFLQQPYKVLCTSPCNIKNALKKLKTSDLDSIRQLNSFKKYLDTLQDSERKLLEDNIHLKNRIDFLLGNCHEKLSEFYLCLRLLHILVSQLPGSPLGKQLRELYIFAMSGGINKSEGFKECYQLLNYHGITQILEKINSMLVYIDERKYEGHIKEKLLLLKEKLEKFDSTKKVNDLSEQGSEKIIIKTRAEFKEVMVALSKSKSEGNFEELRGKVLDCLMNEIFSQVLVPITSLPLHEIIVCDSTRSHSLKRNLVGCQRGDTYRALTQPKDYLLCDCCKLDDPNEIPASLPDVCIAFKLHLEFGAIINLHDWLQAFASIVDPKSAEEEIMDISPLIQSRFLQAVSDLEYMGFVKSSKRKSEHVLRMSWGGCC